MIDQIAKEIVSFEDTETVRMVNYESLLGKFSDLQNMTSEKQKRIAELQKRIEELKTQGFENSNLDEELDQIYEQVNEAANAVSKISNAQLEEVSKYMNPPERIKIALEAIMCLLHQKVMSWDQIKSELNKNLIDSISKFNLTNVPSKIIKLVKDQYLSNDKWDMEKLKRASKSMGPLGDWLKAQLLLAEVMEAKPQAKEILVKRLTIIDLQHDLEGLVMNLNLVQHERKSIQILIQNEKEELDQIKTNLEEKKKEYQEVHRSIFPYLYKSDIGVQTDPNHDFPEDDLQNCAMGSLDGFLDNHFVEEPPGDRSDLPEEDGSERLSMSSRGQEERSNRVALSVGGGDDKPNNNILNIVGSGQNELKVPQGLRSQPGKVSKNNSSRGPSPIKKEPPVQKPINSMSLGKIIGKSNRGVDNSEFTNGNEKSESFQDQPVLKEISSQFEKWQPPVNIEAKVTQKRIKGVQTIDLRFMKNIAELLVADDSDEGTGLWEEFREMIENTPNFLDPHHDNSIYQIKIPGVATPAQMLKPDYFDCDYICMSHVPGTDPGIDSHNHQAILIDLQNIENFTETNLNKSRLGGFSISEKNNLPRYSNVSDPLKKADIADDFYFHNDRLIFLNAHSSMTAHLDPKSQSNTDTPFSNLDAPLTSKDLSTDKPNLPDNGAVRLIRIPSRTCQAAHLARDFCEMGPNEGSSQDRATLSHGIDPNSKTDAGLKHYLNESTPPQGRGSSPDLDHKRVFESVSKKGEEQKHLLNIETELAFPCSDAPDQLNYNNLPRVELSDSGALKFGDGQIDKDSDQNIIHLSLLKALEEPQENSPDSNSFYPVPALSLPEKPARKLCGKVLLVQETKTIDPNFLHYFIPHVIDSSTELHNELSSSNSRPQFTPNTKRSVASDLKSQDNDIIQRGMDCSDSNISSYNRNRQVTRCLSPFGNVYYGKRSTIGNKNALTSLKQKGVVDSNALEYPTDKYEERKEENIQFKKAIFVNKIQEMEPVKAVDYIAELEKSLSNSFSTQDMLVRNNDFHEVQFPSETRLIASQTVSARFCQNSPSKTHESSAFEKQHFSFVPSSICTVRNPNVFTQNTPYLSNFDINPFETHQLKRTHTVLGKLMPSVHQIRGTNGSQVFGNQSQLDDPKVQRIQTPNLISTKQTAPEVATQIVFRSVSPLFQISNLNKK